MSERTNTVRTEPIPWAERWPNQNTHRYDTRYETGDVRDGHKLLRTEEGIEIIHPEACEYRIEAGLNSYTAFNCPLDAAAEWATVPELHADVEEPFKPEMLPMDTEVEIVWTYSSWRYYEGDYDNECSWWLP